MEIVKVLIFIFYTMSFPLKATDEIEIHQGYKLEEVRYMQKDSIAIKYDRNQIIQFFEENEKTYGVLLFKKENPQ